MLKPHISSVINDSQSAFVEKRLITNNAIVTFEAFHSMNFGKINRSNHFAIKIDFSKVFDRVKWNYLESIILAMLFLSHLVSLIMRCIHSVSFSVLINGSPYPSFIPIREVTLFLLIYS